MNPLKTVLTSDCIIYSTSNEGPDSNRVDLSKHLRRRDTWIIIAVINRLQMAKINLTVTGGGNGCLVLK